MDTILRSVCVSSVHLANGCESILDVICPAALILFTIQLWLWSEGDLSWPELKSIVKTFVVPVILAPICYAGAMVVTLLAVQHLPLWTTALVASVCAGLVIVSVAASARVLYRNATMTLRLIFPQETVTQ